MADKRHADTVRDDSTGDRSADVAARPEWQVPPIDEEARVLGGVASGIAQEIGVQPIVIRGSFLLLAAAGGWGVVLYIVAWAAMAAQEPKLEPYEPSTKGASPLHRHLGVGCVVLGLLMGLRLISFGFVDRIVWPAGFVFLGALIAWSHGRNFNEGMSTVARVISGVAVGIGGLLAFGAFSFNAQDGLLALVFAIAIVTGVAVIAAPSLMRIGSALDDERQERVRADEKARMAAHLHDSVLQTLSLIQRHAENPLITAQLARRQERELRSWLYGPTTPAGAVRLSSALQDMATAVEADHGVPIEVVVVGDEAMETVADYKFDALLGATREAAMNASKHSGASRIDVFAEISGGHVEVFVRDTGEGFDRAAIGTDRRGILESIEGRMVRHGGNATITTEVGEGTEVELSMQLTEPDAIEDAETSDPRGADTVGSDATTEAVA